MAPRASPPFGLPVAALAQTREPVRPFPVALPAVLFRHGGTRRR